MSRRTYGILAGVVGSAIGAWWWRRHRMTETISPSGTVIYDNTPTAATDFGEGII